MSSDIGSVQIAPSKGTQPMFWQPQLHKKLIDAALSKGVKIKTGVKVSSVKVEETTIVLEGGEEVHGDLIVAADGVYVSGLSLTFSRNSH